MRTNLVGRYQKNKSYLEKQDANRLVICQRKQPTPVKPLLYILRETTPKNFEYISSLYPTEQDTVFELEYSGSKFKLHLDNTTAEITESS
jgi:hypothetical protein